MQKALLRTCSNNQANPPHVVAGGLSMAHPQMTRGKKRSLLELLTAPALFSHTTFSLQLGTGHKPPALGAIPPLPAPWPSALTAPALLSFCAASSPSIALTPSSSPGNARGGEGKGFPSSAQKCSSVSKDKARPLCNPPAAAATKAGRGGGGGGSVGGTL